MAHKLNNIIQKVMAIVELKQFTAIANRTNLTGLSNRTKINNRESKKHQQN